MFTVPAPPARLLLSAVVLGCAACASPSRPPLETAADSLAYAVAEGAGGAEAWDALPALAFDWAVVVDSTERMRAHHLWDKAGDRTRVEWPVGADSVVVAVFSPSTFDPEAPAGQAAMNGAALGGAALDERLVEAHRRHVNDGYWLLAPLKTLDPGVRRAVGADGQTLQLSFDGVGLTPGDQYAIETEPGTRSMTAWSYVLEGDTARSRWVWLDPAEVETPAGPLRLATKKVKDGDGTAILTEPRAVADLDETAFTDLQPRGEL
ncbi:hypothetical protein RQM47_11590 [Rubrivirga sp. S365]|uniref:hypothetical protein n=1 Tax=Rubrivirga sp. S365 TaxID=3076080 RepID=UPI0028C5A4BD|nr:hypothetical protein [Rubrivirga sp. S365]MDT7857283.1 hypothetical protein [Rubrivirga sp. S365]